MFMMPPGPVPVLTENRSDIVLMLGETDVYTQPSV
jgi:hypothetical protein